MPKKISRAARNPADSKDMGNRDAIARVTALMMLIIQRTEGSCSLPLGKPLSQCLQ